MLELTPFARNLLRKIFKYYNAAFTFNEFVCVSQDACASGAMGMDFDFSKISGRWSPTTANAAGLHYIDVVHVQQEVSFLSRNCATQFVARATKLYVKSRHCRLIPQK